MLLAMIGGSLSILDDEARRVRKNTFQARNMGAPSWRGSKGALVTAMGARERSHRGRTLGV